MSREYSLYYICGENWQAEGALNTLRNNQKNKHNLIEYNKKVDSVTVLASADTSILFGDKKLVIVSNIKGLNWDYFLDYFSNPNPNTRLVFVSDKLNLPPKVKKVFEKNGKILDYKEVRQKQLPAMIKKIVKHYGKNISDKDIGTIINYIGTNIGELNSEIVKLIYYIRDRDTITGQDITTVLEESHVGSVFELINYISSGNKKKSLQLYFNLINNGQSEFGIITLITRRMRQMCDAKKLVSMNMPKEEIGKRLKIHPYYLQATLRKAQALSWNKIMKMYEIIEWTQNALKYKKTTNRILMENLIDTISY